MNALLNFRNPIAAMWRFTPVIATLGELREDQREFLANLGYIVPEQPELQNKVLFEGRKEGRKGGREKGREGRKTS